MSKQAFLDTVKAQNYILTEAQKAKVKSFLIENEVSREDIPELKKIAKANNIKVNKDSGWWKKQAKNLEIREKRDTFNKTLYDPTDETKRVLVASSTPLHYFDGTEYHELPDLSFPNGKVLPKGRTKHLIKKIPAWARMEVNKDSSEAYLYDKADTLLATYKYPTVTLNGEYPYTITNNGEFVRYGVKPTDHRPFEGEEIERNPKCEDAKFAVDGDNFGFIVSKKASRFELQAWDDTDTSSTVVKDNTMFNNQSANSNYGSDVLFAGVAGDNRKVRPIMHFTLPSDPGGTITDVDVEIRVCLLYLSGKTVNVHELTQTAWDESTSCWNNYSTGNAWTSPGGDFDSTIISTVNIASVASHTLPVMGDSATNPLTLDWGDDLHLLLQATNETSKGMSYIDSKEATTGGTKISPYLTITYTAGGGSTFKPRVIMF